MSDQHHIWVCVDCYFAHHYGAHQHEFVVSILLDGIVVDDFRAQLWYAGEDADPVGGWHEIKVNHSLQHNREPLGLLEENVDVFDATCSNHDNREHECFSCDEGDVGEPEGEFIQCAVCGGSGTLQEPCPHCGSDDDENGIQEFSWSRCHGCGSPLGGARYRLMIDERSLDGTAI